MPTLCLNMIVKNESKIIQRLLESVFPVIDSYCICDTGSTDNTIELIQQFFKTKEVNGHPAIPGKIVSEPFRDFGYNRTFALRECNTIPNAEYILLLDADMIFVIDPSIDIQQFKTALCKDVYCVFQGSNTFYYKNIRILKNNPQYYYWGVTHEYVKTTPFSTYEDIPKTKIFIIDIGDGGSKNEKFTRDLELLKKGLEEYPDNDRYVFYLANTYFGLNQYTNAIEMYEKRIKLGGWNQEIWYSYYSIGRSYKELGDIPNAIHYWLEGYNYLPQRIENLYEIICHYRKNNKHRLAYTFYELANYENIRLNPSTSMDHLFLQKDIYEYKLDYELSIIGYYCNLNNNDIVKSCINVLSNKNATEEIQLNVLSNYKFYAIQMKSLECQFKRKDFESNYNVLNQIGDSLNIDKTIFLSSTPSICLEQFQNPRTKTNLIIINVRFVNYRINQNGEYELKNTITTINVIAMIDISSMYRWRKISEFILNYEKKYDEYYEGMEDIRLLSQDGNLLFNSNRIINRPIGDEIRISQKESEMKPDQDDKTNFKIMIEHGKIDLITRTANSTILRKTNQKKIEKNWVLFTDSNYDIKIIYEWYPLTIGYARKQNDPKVKNSRKQETTEMVISDKIKTPVLFKYVRGSSNGIIVDGNVWFLCHIVSIEHRRYYYHLFVVMDIHTFEIIKYSRIMTFEGSKIEYTLGMIYLEDLKQFMIGYSINDCQTKYMLISKLKVDETMIEIGSMAA